MNRTIYKIIALIFIFLIAFILRFYKLGQIPDGLQQDETSLGYNAYSVLKTSRDEHNTFLPQNFKAFGEYKLPGYIYSSILPIAIFGLNPFAIRFISALSGFLSIIIVFFLCRLLLENKYIPYIVTLLLSVNPWHLQFSRAAFEVMLANFFILCGTWLWIKGIYKSKFLYICLATILFVASIYTYNIARLFTPVFLVLLTIIFWKKIKLLPKRFLAGFVGTGITCIIPFIVGTLHHGGVDSTFGTLIFTSAKVQAQLQEYRSYFIFFPEFINKLFFNNWLLSVSQYIINIFAHLSVNFYFISSFDGITSIGTTAYWYIFELPLIIWGAIWLWKSKGTTSQLLFAWIIALVLISSLTREPPQATRTFFLIFPITFCSGIGFYNLIYKIYFVSNKWQRYGAFSISFILAFYYIFNYFSSYYVRFPIYYAKNWRTADRDVVSFIKANQNKYNKILIDRTSGFVYTSLLTYLPYPSSDFQNQTIWSHDDSEGFSYPIKFGKFEFRDIDWSKDLNYPKTLIITTANKRPTNVDALDIIYYPERPVVINIGQKIIRYPVKEIAYILITTNSIKGLLDINK